jgi:hypothetical protein
LAEQQEQVTGGRPFVVHVDGEVVADGRAITLRIVRSDHDALNICLRTEDVQYLVSMLLTLGCEAKRLQPPSEADGSPSGAIPLPLSAISIGQDDHDQTFMMIEVGSTALMFGVAPNCLKELGQTLLTLSAAAGRKPS